MRGSLGSHSTLRTVAPLFLHVPLAGCGRYLQACEQRCEVGQSTDWATADERLAQRRDGRLQPPLPSWAFSSLRSAPLPRHARQEEKSTCPGRRPPVPSLPLPCLHDHVAARWWTWGFNKFKVRFGWILEFWSYLTSRPIKSKILSFYYQERNNNIKTNLQKKANQPNKKLKNPPTYIQIQSKRKHQVSHTRI